MLEGGPVSAAASFRGPGKGSRLHQGLDRSAPQEFQRVEREDSRREGGSPQKKREDGPREVEERGKTEVGTPPVSVQDRRQGEENRLTQATPDDLQTEDHG